LDEYRKNNQAMWDEYAQVHAGTQMYDLAGFKAGRNKLHALERAEVGPVEGKRLLHLQCHFGMDTLSWARLGAEVTGVDFSPEGIRLARELSDEMAIPARFINCDIYDLPNQLDETFDVVYTSYGVLTWLSDIPQWASIAARYVRPGGTFYIAEFHPTSYIFSDTADHWVAEYDYFDTNTLSFPTQGTYADPTADIKTPVSYEWNYQMGTVVSSLIDAGLRIEFLHEFDYTFYAAFKFLEQSADGVYRAPAGMPRVPMMFSIRATKV
jgi:ubiquinone/menaquinone biosynthesis C-methylase UbiE